VFVGFGESVPWLCGLVVLLLEEVLVEGLHGWVSACFNL
jgi:hypothetical protein